MSVSLSLDAVLLNEHPFNNDAIFKLVEIFWVNHFLKKRVFRLVKSYKSS